MVYIDEKLILIFGLFVAVVSSITVEGKQTLGNVELKWKLEVLNMINYMTMILQMDGGALGICP